MRVWDHGICNMDSCCVGFRTGSVCYTGCGVRAHARRGPATATTTATTTTITTPRITITIASVTYRNSCSRSCDRMVSRGSPTSGRISRSRRNSRCTSGSSTTSSGSSRSSSRSCTSRRSSCSSSGNSGCSGFRDSTGPLVSRSRDPRRVPPGTHGRCESASVSASSAWRHCAPR